MCSLLSLARDSGLALGIALMGKPSPSPCGSSQGVTTEWGVEMVETESFRLVATSAVAVPNIASSLEQIECSMLMG